ncbi:hypothetical protein [Arcticibacter tournemirensis]
MNSSVQYIILIALLLLLQLVSNFYCYNPGSCYPCIGTVEIYYWETPENER